MKKAGNIFLFSILFQGFMLVSGCKESGQSNYARDSEAIKAVIARHMNAIDSLDIATILDCMVEDHVEMPQSSPKVVGKEAYVSYFSSFAEFFKTVKEKELSFPADELIVSGDWAFQTGTYSTKFILKDGSVVRDKGNYIWIFKKDEDGLWKWARVISNSNPAPIADDNSK